MSQLTKRARSVLYAVVTEFIATGEPVGSRTLTKKYGFDLSPATIRNVLADLEDAGFLVQAHTSAGRTPTESAFRLYIDALMRVRQVTADDSSRIASWFERLPAGSDIVRETGKLLCSLTGAPAVLARPRIETRTLRKLRFIPTRPGELLSVLVLSDGAVENRYIHVDAPLADNDLERLHNLLEEHVDGSTLSTLRTELARTLEARRDELAGLSHLGLTLVEAALDGSPRGRMDVVVEEASRLLDQPEFATAERARELMRALEDREKLLVLLDRTLESTRVQVFLGRDTSEAMGYPVSIVAAPYREGDVDLGGAIGIIGPTRMDYPSVVPLIGATAAAMSSALSRSAETTRTVPRPGSKQNGHDR